LENTYKNPFSEYNANVMDNNMILEYWSNPFNFVKFGLTEQDVFDDPNPQVFMGGRGTGKTMFLRYCSFAVQKNLLKYSNLFENPTSVGFYIRIDGPILRSFSGYGISDEKWLVIFTHYFELYVAKAYFAFLESQIDSDNMLSSSFLIKCSELLTSNKELLKTLSEILEFIDEKLKEVNLYRAQIPLKDVLFESQIVYSSQSLSFGIPDILRLTTPQLHKDFKFVLMIDEYENFLEPQQRLINSLLKFVRPGITFRLGMRLEGFRTYDTISSDDFIKEGRDYRKITFEEVLIKDSGYTNYLKDIANKRLKRIECFAENNLVDIANFLGDKENLEEEALDLVGEKGDKIFDAYNIKLKKDRDNLRCIENPLLQVLNCLWFNRGKTSKDINKTMKDYFAGLKNPEVVKYKMDYVDKYKLSLMFILATIYKKDKSYYSFNTFSYLSSGIVGHFIEICRRCFQYAEFEDKSSLIKNGQIPKSLQNSAARDLAETELQQIRRIEKYGNKLYVFALNLGETFRKYHRDLLIRYPETNQFSVDKTLLIESTKEAFEAAQRWSVIQRKQKTQQQSIGKKKNDVFTLNRIFAPIFQFSYRTRGGFSEEYSSVEITALMEKEGTEFRLDRVRNKKVPKDDSQQELGL
jgi:hypothetical protein